MTTEVSFDAGFGGDLKAIAKVVTEVNVANGWFESDRTFGDEVALIHSEVSEMLEEYREHGTSALLQFNGVAGLVPDGEYGADKLRQFFEENGSLPKPIGVASEAADVLIRLLDFCHRYDIDLEGEVVKKLRYNATRGHRHGGKNL